MYTAYHKIRYKWKAVSCDMMGEVMCSLRIPNCPRHFEWVQAFDNSSCFLAPQGEASLIEPTEEQTTSVKQTYSFWIMEHECSKFGARQAVLNNEIEQSNLHQWLMSKMSYGNYYFSLGMKQLESGSETHTTMVHNNM